MNFTHDKPARRRAFSLVEILVAILVIGALLSILLVALGKAKVFAGSTKDLQSALTIKTGVEQFKEEFGFLPPMVRERFTTPMVLEGTPGQIAVYSLRNPTHLAFLRTTPALDALNPFQDERYSELTLGYYLAGSLGANRGPGINLPIDGVSGPGLYAPRADGTFDVPKDVERAAGNAPGDTNRGGKKYDPFIPLTGRGLKVFTDPSNALAVTVRDDKDVPIRYYRWEHNDGAQLMADMNVPRIVARVPGTIAGEILRPERDLSANPKVRDAQFAIVSAGPNGVFGDEDISVITRALGGGDSPNADAERRLRLEAEKDNIVEVGR